MRFLWPEMLWMLLLIPVLLAGYGWLLRRRMRVAVITPDLSAIRLAQAGRRNYRRHIPPALCLAAIACGLIGSAGPSARVVLPADYMTLILAMDVSRSMLAEDVPPNRIKASQEAVKAFIEGLPQNVRVGLVTFAGTAQRAHGITDSRQDIYEAIDRFQLQRGTATGSGLLMALDMLLPDAGIKLETTVYGWETGGAPMQPDGQRDRASIAGAGAGLSRAEQASGPPGSYRSGAIVLLSDGRRTTGSDPIEAARLAARLGVRVHTVAFGTPDGFIPGFEGLSFYARVDEETLRQMAQVTQGEFFRASNAADLQGIYEHLSTRIRLERQDTQIGALFALAAMVLALLAIGLSLFWFKSMPVRTQPNI
jgi:Ca-activated chloride channel family protein